jgi:hypothetical protein
MENKIEEKQIDPQGNIKLKVDRKKGALHAQKELKKRLAEGLAK